MSTHVGRVILSINGLPYAQAKSVRPSVSTGRKAIKGMSPTGDPIGTIDGTPEYTLDCEFYIPKLPEAVTWEKIENAVLTIAPRGGLGPTTMYTGVFTMEVGESFGEDDAATRTVKMGALARKEIG